MTFDQWWKENSNDFTNKYINMSLYDIAHSAYEFGLETMYEEKYKEISELKDYKHMYEELCK